MKFLVEFGESREQDSPQVCTSLRADIKFLFGIRGLEDITLQRWDPEWEAFVNLKDGETLPDKAKLKCFIPLVHAAEKPAMTESTDSCILHTPPSFSVSSHSSDPKLLFNVVEARMSQRLKDTLVSGVLTEWAPKHELINLVSDVLYSIDKYPTKFVKNELIEEIINRYPCLRNKIGDPCQAWKMKIDNGLKQMRSKDRTLSTPRQKKRKALDFASPVRGEGASQLPPYDETLIEQQQQLMVRELKRGHPDEEKLQLLMQETYPHRRDVIFKEGTFK
ncbi:hypothetical protein CAPTEDRAFT_196584 [Capitella teleta]|uniref:Uncharacterized protein n=1 Tax=Capitella teleta TaxID=283909 RepID=R7UDF8_CAPTE|nr:hypothetical protein CAPTEDRAFT_196584 [Capitella teleta]|eukprot:ELU01828.1 hypothetical protein CAPTEDRAFT_196584 [Capitella teleta]